MPTLVCHSLGSAALQVLPSVIALSAERRLHSSASGCENGIDASISLALKTSLLALLKCVHDAAATWRPKVAESLRKLGCGAEVDAALRFVQRQAEKETMYVLGFRVSWSAPKLYCCNSSSDIVAV